MKVCLFFSILICSLLAQSANLDTSCDFILNTQIKSWLSPAVNSKFKKIPFLKNERLTYLGSPEQGLVQSFDNWRVVHLKVKKIKLINSADDASYYGTAAIGYGSSPHGNEIKLRYWPQTYTGSQSYFSMSKTGAAKYKGEGSEEIDYINDNGKCSLNRVIESSVDKKQSEKRTVTYDFDLCRNLLAHTLRKCYSTNCLRERMPLILATEKRSIDLKMNVLFDRNEKDLGVKVKAVTNAYKSCQEHLAVQQNINKKPAVLPQALPQTVH